MEDRKIFRTLDVFRFDNKHHVRAISIDNVPLEVLWVLAGSPQDDPMLFAREYDVSRLQLLELQKYVAFEFDLMEFEYTLGVSEDRD